MVKLLANDPRQQLFSFFFLRSTLENWK